MSTTTAQPYAGSMRHHEAAMDLAERGDHALRRDEHEQARALYHEAFEVEVRAIRALPSQDEPTWSVLHRSAASLAFQCGELREAERLIAVALAGSPPDEIADELRDLLEQVYQVRGIGALRSA